MEWKVQQKPFVPIFFASCSNFVKIPEILSISGEFRTLWTLYPCTLNSYSSYYSVLSGNIHLEIQIFGQSRYLESIGIWKVKDNLKEEIFRKFGYFETKIFTFQKYRYLESSVASILKVQVFKKFRYYESLDISKIHMFRKSRYFTLPFTSLFTPK